MTAGSVRPPDDPLPAPHGEPADASLIRNHDFRRVFSAGAVSKLGTQVSYIAIPLVAISVLDASAGQVGLLATMATVAWLFVGLPAGAWVDRIRRRRVMIVTDVVRAGLFASVPIAWWLDALTIQQLYAVVLIAGATTVFFDVANQSFLPTVVGRQALMSANGKLVGFEAVITMAGRSGGGFLVAALTAPLAIAVDAASYLCSAILVARVGRREPLPARRRRGSLVPEIREGARHVLGHELLRPIVLAGAATNLSMQLVVTMLPIVFIRELGLSEGVLGVFLALGGLGALLGATVARRVGRWLGAGRALWIAGLSSAPFALLVPQVGGGVWLWPAAGAWIVLSARIGMDNVLNVTFRQRATPDRLLGRMNGTFRFLLTGAVAIGAASAGVVGETGGPRAALWAGAIGMSVSWLPVFFSPLRQLRTLPHLTAAAG